MKKNTCHPGGLQNMLASAYAVVCCEEPPVFKVPHTLLSLAFILFYMPGPYPESEFLIALVSSWHDAAVRDGPLGHLVPLLEKNSTQGAKASQWCRPLHMMWGLRHHSGTVPSPTERLGFSRTPVSGWTPIRSVIIVTESGHTAPITWLVPQNKAEGVPL